MSGTTNPAPFRKPISLPHPPGRAQGQPLDFTSQKDAIKKGIAHRLQAVPELAGLNILEIHGELVLRLPERLIFGVGDARLKDDGKKALNAIAAEIGGRPIGIRVEGHTDSAPIHTAQFPSNWELSTARATAVVVYLLGTGKVEPERLAAAGYGQHQPVAKNDTLEGRAQNGASTSSSSRRSTNKPMRRSRPRRRLRKSAKAKGEEVKGKGEEAKGKAEEAKGEEAKARARSQGEGEEPRSRPRAKVDLKAKVEELKAETRARAKIPGWRPTTPRRESPMRSTDAREKPAYKFEWKEPRP